jgi:hypothetical protein
MKTDNCIGIWKNFWCCSKALNKLDLIEFISQFSKLRHGRYYFIVDFVAGNSNKILRK